MKGIVVAGVLYFLFVNQCKADDFAEYMRERSKLIEMDSQLSIGNKLQLSDREMIVNDMLMRWKNVDYDSINFSGNYFTYRDAMRRSRGYQMIRKMPKGAALHVHGSLMLDPDELMKFTYEEYLQVCLTNDYLKFHYSITTPTKPCPVQWRLLEYLRLNHSNLAQFDAILKERLTLGPEDFGLHFDENESWKQFSLTLSAILSLIEYRPVREKYIYRSLQSFYDDNVMYAEIRIALYPLYELNGTVHDKLYMAALHNTVARKFAEANPDFGGLKIIISPSRKLSLDQLQYEVDLARTAKRTLPDVIAGLDFVGQETRGKPLMEFLRILLETKHMFDFFFHAGETNQYGTETDENLFDAVLLESKRIGHAYSLIKHPALMKAVKQRDIGIEVNVISNSVLSLVQDLRNHPLAVYLALGLPVVLSSDDPGMWGSKPLSDDFYVAFVAIASKQADLGLLKQLAVNSIRYSALDDRGKMKLFITFEKKWAQFVDNIIMDIGF